MVYKGFRFNIIVRIFLILLLSSSLAYVLTHNPALFTTLSILIALLLTVINLIYYIESSHRNLTHFLLSIKQSDFTGSYAAKGGKAYEELSEAMNDIIREFAKVNAEKELHYQFLQTLNENINVAILCFNVEGVLVSMNPAAKKMFSNQPIKLIDDFKSIDERLLDALKTIQPEQKRVVHVIVGEHEVQLGLQMKEIVIRAEPLRVYLLQNLSDELESKEIEAWQTLMRVLTHEIMNSVTPVSALADAVKKLMTNTDGSAKQVEDITKENAEDIAASLQTMSVRTKGLLKFVQAFKEFAQPKNLKLDRVDIVEITDALVLLLKPDFRLKNVSLDYVKNASNIITFADRALLEQVFINLIKNALEASRTDGTGTVSIYVRQHDSKSIRIIIGDNGYGIDAETLPKIFVPFFTTKPEGTGVGLSFSRQVIRLHRGSINVNSAPGEGTTFTIDLPAF